MSTQPKKDDDFAELFLLGVALGKEKSEKEEAKKSLAETAKADKQRDKDARQLARTNELIISKQEEKEREIEREKRLGALHVKFDED